MSKENKEVQTTITEKCDQVVQATATPGVKVMASKEVQTTPPLCKVEKAAQEALAINPELKNNPEFQKFLSKKWFFFLKNLKYFAQKKSE